MVSHIVNKYSLGKEKHTDKYDIICFSLSGFDLGMNGKNCESRHQASPDYDWSTEKRQNRIVHQRMFFDKIEINVWQRLCVINTRSWAWAGNLKKTVTKRIINPYL